jgi:hypothetical protein
MVMKPLNCEVAFSVLRLNVEVKGFKSSHLQHSELA